MAQTFIKSVWMLIGTLALQAACASSVTSPPHQSRQTAPSQSGAGSPVSFEVFKQDLLRYEGAFEDFRGPGPFSYDVHENVSFTLGKNDVVVTDVVAPRSRSKSPVAIISHGNHSRKEAHRYQAKQLASYGITAIALQLPNTSQWMQNGRRISKFVHKLQKSRKIVGRSFDKQNIVLIGHSFGGSAITVAAGRGAPVKGLILLDPAVVDPKVSDYMRKVNKPVLLLGADHKIFRSRKRRLFFKHIQGEMAEISVRGATHDDAQFPSMFSLSAFGLDPYTSPNKQQTFAAAITLAAFSLVSTSGLDFAWDALQSELKAGELMGAKRRQPLQAARTSH